MKMFFRIPFPKKIRYPSSHVAMASLSGNYLEDEFPQEREKVPLKNGPLDPRKGQKHKYRELPALSKLGPIPQTSNGSM